MVAGPDAARGECVRELVGPLIGLRVRESPIAADERLALRHGIDDLLPEIGEVVFHGALKVPRVRR